MGHQVRLPRGKPRPPGRGARKPGAHHPASERASPIAFQAFGELQQREFERSSWPMRIFEHGTFRFLAVNDAAVKLYGYTREEFLAMTAKDTRHPEELDDFLTTLAEPTGYFRHRGPRRHVKKNGEIIVVEAVTQDILFKGRKARLSMNIDVTERKRAEVALRESNEFLRSMIESSPDCIKVLDLDGRLLMMSAGGQRLLQIDDIAPMLNTSWLDFWKGGDRDAALAALTTARAGGVGKFEGYFPTIKGEPKWWDVVMTPILDAQGRPEKLLAVSRDVTKRKDVERALHESESKYRNLVESSSDLIWSADAAGRITFINEAVRRIYGYEPEEMLGKPVAELLGDGHWKKPFGFFRKMLAEDRSVADYECEVRGKDGQRVILSSNAIVMRDAEGRRIGVTGVSKDITARKRMEAELRQSEERFRQLAENIRQVFWINTPAGDHIDYISPAYEEIWGRSRESLYRDPRSWMETIHPEDLPAVLDAQEKMPSGQSTDVEYRIIRPDGTLRWIRDCSYPMRRGDGTLHTCGIAEDITDLKRAEEARLIHAIHQRDALVREVHHRLKNHLQGIAGLLRDKASGNPAAAQAIEAAAVQLQSVAVVYGLQSESAEGGVPLRRVLEAICASVESLNGGRVVRRFPVDTSNALRLTETEAVPVAVALNELIFNALKHCAAPGGARSIEVVLAERKGGAEVRIVNPGKLSTGFDYARGAGTGTGLDLVRTLLGTAGSELSFDDRDARVEVTLSLRPPLLVTARAPVVA